MTYSYGADLALMDLPKLREILLSGGIERPGWEAEQIAKASQNEAARKNLAQRRASGEPLAYVLGEWDFYGITFKVTPDVLIPRADTELLAELAIGWAVGVPVPVRVLDLCCGSGCLGVALAHNISCDLTLADLSRAALEIAAMNCKGLPSVKTLCCDALKPPPKKLPGFDLLVCNPPYIARDEWGSLDFSVTGYEPRMALDGGENGLTFYEAIAGQWHTALTPGGRAAFEVGYTQAGQVCDILRENGFSGIEVFKDLSGIERVVTGIASK
ncbi:MAG: peptide chain release factor N(5)-glutamine methyltransferase [Oscillospiraceae bacterium]|nr:peptide chain release factor N(5)-glutamine methyltransferase [Oscillospiraceae bacterium]